MTDNSRVYFHGDETRSDTGRKPVTDHGPDASSISPVILFLLIQYISSDNKGEGKRTVLKVIATLNLHCSVQLYSCQVIISAFWISVWY